MGKGKSVKGGKEKRRGWEGERSEGMRKAMEGKDR